jgi:hypothetical protein
MTFLTRYLLLMEGQIMLGTLSHDHEMSIYNAIAMPEIFPAGVAGGGRIE